VSGKHPQRETRVGAVLEVRYRNAGQFLVSYCTNLSRGGLFVATPTPAQVGTVLTLAMGVPGMNEPASLKARVRWVRPTPDEGGPAGMGLSFERVDEVLGVHIDRIVARAEPLRIDLVGRPDSAWRHIAALVRALVTCEIVQRTWGDDARTEVLGADLVLIDVDGAPPEAMELLEYLAEVSNPPPALALCAARDVKLRAEASQFAPVVATPVDSDTLQTAVLEALGQVAVFMED
jgi:uncharacterized protein (TIGR02266 family)